MTMARTAATCGLLVLFAIGRALPLGAAEVLLKNSWIAAHRNRATVTTAFTVDEAHNHPNPVGDGSDDGDLHVAGRAPDIGLPMVFEISNARLKGFEPVLARVSAAEQAKETVTVSGVWRLWFEHAGKDPQTQGDAVPVPVNSNPDHLFEIHPATRFDTFSLSPAFVPIEGYTAHEVKKVFDHYEKRVFPVARGPTFTSIKSTKAYYNYAAFTIVLAGAPKKIADGVVVLADVRGPDDASLVASPRRMVFVEGTRPAEIALNAKKGDRFEAIGVPRVNLDRVWALSVEGQAVNLKGAYEMIIVGIRE